MRWNQSSRLARPASGFSGCRTRLSRLASSEIHHRKVARFGDLSNEGFRLFPGCPKSFVGLVWNIERDTGIIDAHSSEAGINKSLIDYTIINTDLDGFKAQVENLTDVAVSRKVETNA